MRYWSTQHLHRMRDGGINKGGIMEELTVRHIKTIDSACNVLKMITCIPADRMDWDFVSSVIGGAMKLLKIADQEAREILIDKKEAPEPAGTETSAKEKTIQEDDNTEKPATSKRQKVTQDMKTEMILMRRDGVPVTKIAEKFGVSTYTVYEYTN